MLAAERDFKEQNGWLQEELGCRGQLVIFCLKFHCKLNFIERCWCGCKWYARGNCQHADGDSAGCTESSLLSNYPPALHAIDAYGPGAFKEPVCKAHQKW